MNDRFQSFPLKSDLEKGIISINCAASTSSTLNSSYSSTETNALLEEISEMQPSLHEDKKWCCEKIFKNILVYDCDLTKSEYKKYNNLRKECLILYDENNDAHEKLLKDLFDNFVEINETSKNYKNENASWKTLGFQGNNPRTDFRAGGFYSLKFMHYFIWKYSDELLQTISIDYFLFAVVSIRLTYLFRLFINLVKDEDMETSLKSHKMHSCSRR